MPPVQGKEGEVRHLLARLRRIPEIRNAVKAGGAGHSCERTEEPTQARPALKPCCGVCRPSEHGMKTTVVKLGAVALLEVGFVVL